MVEEFHRWLVMMNEILMPTVDKAFGRLDLEPEKLRNIYDRCVKVLHLMVKAKGDNPLSEKNRGESGSLENLTYEAS